MTWFLCCFGKLLRDTDVTIYIFYINYYKIYIIYLKLVIVYIYTYSCYMSIRPEAVARANQNEFDPVRQFYDRAGTLAKQGHTVDKVEIIVLGGTWSHYPKDYQARPRNKNLK